MSTPAEAETIVAEQPQDEPEEEPVPPDAPPPNHPEFHPEISAIVCAGKLPASRVKELRIQLAKKRLDPLENTPAALALAFKASAVYGRKKNRAAAASARQREALKLHQKNDAAGPDTAMAAEVLLPDEATDVVADVPTVAAVNEPVAAVAAVNKPVATQGLFVAAPYAVKVAPAKVVPKGSALRPDKTESLVAPGKGLFRPAVVKTPKRTGSLSNLFA
jgi:hypothetical protein